MGVSGQKILEEEGARGRKRKIPKSVRDRHTINDKRKKRDVKRIKTTSLQENKKLGKIVKKRKEVNKLSLVNGIRTRTSPMTLQDTVSLLNEEHQSVVVKMGLGSLLKMSIDGVPSKLGYYVVDNLDTDTMEVYTIGSTLKINEEVISNIHGLPNGGVDLDELDVNDKGRDMIARWKKQYSKKKVRPSDVSTMILESSDVGELFKMIEFYVNPKQNL